MGYRGCDGGFAMPGKNIEDSPKTRAGTHMAGTAHEISSSDDIIAPSNPEIPPEVIAALDRVIDEYNRSQPLFFTEFD
jgi:hypothetical protein